MNENLLKKKKRLHKGSSRIIGPPAPLVRGSLLCLNYFLKKNSSVSFGVRSLHHLNGYHDGSELLKDRVGDDGQPAGNLRANDDSPGGSQKCIGE